MFRARVFSYDFGMNRRSFAIALSFIAFVALPSANAFASDESAATPTSISLAAAPLITGVEIRGVLVGEGDLLRQLNIPIGAHFSQNLARESIKKLYELGEFGDISLYTERSAKGVKLIFSVEVIRKILRVRISGSNAIKESEIIIAADLNEGESFTHKRKSDAINKILELYNRSGYQKTEVDISAIPVGEADTFVEVFIHEGDPTRIKNISFHGTPLIADNLLIGAMAQKQGGILDINLLEDDIKKLRELYRRWGFREAKISSQPIISYTDDDQANVSIGITAGPRVEVEIYGNIAKSRGELEKAIKLAEASDFSEAGVRRLTEAMLKYLREDGYLAAEVESRLETSESGKRKRVVFNIDEGRRCRIKDIVFRGNKSESDQLLRSSLSEFVGAITQGESALSLINASAADTLGFSGAPPKAAEENIQNNDPMIIYRREVYQKAVAMLEERYHRSGYLSARVKIGRESFSPSKSQIILFIDIKEGIRTYIKEINIIGAKALNYSFKEWQENAKDAPFDRVLAEEKRLEIANSYNENGYIFNRVNLFTEFSPDRSLVTLNYNVSEGPQVRISRIIIKGYRATAPAVISENLVLNPGDIFRPQQVEESRRNLFKLGIFGNVAIRPVQPDLPEETKSVLTQVEERSFQTFEVGPGISTEDGIRAFAEYQHLNLLGYALQLSARGRVSYQIFDFFLDELQARRLRELSVQDVVERRADIGLSYPRILYFPKIYGLPYKAGARLNLIHQRENTRAYGLDQNSIIPGLDFELIPSLILSIQYELELTFLEVLALKEEVVLKQRERDILMLPEGRALFGAVKPAIILDRRDNPFNTRKGYLSSFTTEFVNSLSGDLDTSFIKYYGKLNFYIPAAKALVLAASLQAGNIVSTSNLSVDGKRTVAELSENERILDERARTPLNKRFYLGGRGSLRGFYEKSLVPSFSQTPASRFRDIEGLNAQVQTFGGNTFALAKLEARIPLTATLGFAAFSDIGGLWLRSADMEVGDLRPSAGGGLRYATPVGPLSLDIGVNLAPNRAIQEPSYAVHFSIGTF
ncbi:MAG: hypothetical protein Kow0090_04300 [Myxococcota bacterium]